MRNAPLTCQQSGDHNQDPKAFHCVAAQGFGTAALSPVFSSLLLSFSQQQVEESPTEWGAGGALTGRSEERL